MRGVCKGTWKAEERAGGENSPALAQLALFSSRASAQVGQGSWVGTLGLVLYSCYVHYGLLTQYFLKYWVLSKNTQEVAFYLVQNETIYNPEIGRRLRNMSWAQSSGASWKRKKTQILCKFWWGEHSNSPVTGTSSTSPAQGGLQKSHLQKRQVKQVSVILERTKTQCKTLGSHYQQGTGTPQRLTLLLIILPQSQNRS